MDIKVAVMCRNASGEPEIVATTVPCTREEYDNGDHYKRAEAEAEEKGYESVMAFDERDPAWQATGWGMLGAPMPGETQTANKVILYDQALQMAADMGYKTIDGALGGLRHERLQLAVAIRDAAAQSGLCAADAPLGVPRLITMCNQMAAHLSAPNVYKKFFDEAVIELQDAFLDGKEAGSELLTNAGGLITRYLDHDIPDAGQECLLYFAFGPEGYWGDGEGYGNRADEATFSADATRHDDCLLDGAVVIGLSLGEINATGLLSFPDLSDLQGAAEDAMHRARENEFTISADNAAEVMREELALDANVDISLLPQEFDPVLSLVMLAQVDKEAELATAQPSQSGS